MLEDIKLLIAEDNSDFQLILEQLLKPLGFTLTITQDGEAALELYKSQSFDLVLMDFRLPKISGIDVTKKIRHWEEQQNCSKTPIIAISSSKESKDINKFYDAGGSSYINKTQLFTNLLPTVNQLLNLQGSEPASKSHSLKNILPQFKENLKKDFDRLNQAIANKNYQEVKSISHNLAGSSGLFGYQDLCKQFQNMHSSAEQKDDSNIQNHHHQIEHIISQILKQQ